MDADVSKNDIQAAKNTSRKSRRWKGVRPTEEEGA